MAYLLRIVLLTLLCCFSVGCVSIPYGLYDDERGMGTIMDDSAIKTDIKAKLMKRHFSDGFSVAVYCYGGKVFLVGTAPEAFRAEAITLAKEQKGVQSVTTHWFEGTSSTTNDAALSLRLATNLITAKDVSSTQVDTDVFNDEVVLLGMVKDQVAANRVIKVARDTSGVRKVVSYLLLKP